ncbi:hypothetical protein ACFRFQ_05325 [Rhodococcus sp. NPDC056743]
MSSDSEGTTAGNGNRLRCNVCGSEAIVTKAGGSALSCCAQPVEITFGA